MRLKPRVSNALRTAIATAALAVSVYAQSAPKPTLDSVDKQLKQSSTDQAPTQPGRGMRSARRQPKPPQRPPTRRRIEPPKQLRPRGIAPGPVRRKRRSPMVPARAS